MNRVLSKLVETSTPITTTAIALYNIDTRETSYQVTITGDGAVSGQVYIEVSNDNVGWMSDVNSVFNLSGTNNVSSGFVSNVSWGYARVRVVSLTGTNVSCTVTMLSGRRL